MPVLKPRNRLVYFRVSEDEYQRYNRFCESMGSRSISDLARSAMQSIVETGNDDRMTEKLAVLEALVGNLSRKVDEIAETLGRAECQNAQSK